MSERTATAEVLDSTGVLDSTEVLEEPELATADLLV